VALFFKESSQISIKPDKTKQETVLPCLLFERFLLFVFLNYSVVCLNRIQFFYNWQSVCGCSAVQRQMFWSFCEKHPINRYLWASSHNTESVWLFFGCFFHAAKRHLSDAFQQVVRCVSSTVCVFSWQGETLTGVLRTQKQHSGNQEQLVMTFSFTPANQEL